MEVRVGHLPEEFEHPDLPKLNSPPQYFQLPMLLAAVGPCGRGKTYSVCKFVKWCTDQKVPYFTRIFAMSPTYASNTTFHVLPIRPTDIYNGSANNHVNNMYEILDKISQDAHWYEEITTKYTDCYKKYLECGKDHTLMEKIDYKYMTIMQSRIREFYDDTEQIYKMMPVKCKLLKKIIKARPRLKLGKIRKEFVLTPLIVNENKIVEFYPPPPLQRPSPVWIIDDCSNSKLYANSVNNPLIDIGLRHRHFPLPGYGLSIICCVQNFKGGVTRALRNVVPLMLIFRCDPKTVEDICDEVADRVTPEEFISLYDIATEKKHGFLLVNKNEFVVEKMFRKGWDTLLILPHRLKESQLLESEEDQEQFEYLLEREKRLDKKRKHDETKT